MEKFLTDRWHDIISLNSAQWFVLLILAVAIGTGLFYLFNWLYSQRFTAAKDLMDLQKRYIESYAGKPPLLPNLDQAIDFIDTELQVWKRGQKGANRISAALGSVHDAKLLEVHARLYEHLEDQQQRDNLVAEQATWLAQRTKRAEGAVESRGGTLAPLEYNIEFIKATKERISELETRLKSFEQPQRLN